MKKPITSAMAALLACLNSSPGMARSDQKAPPATEPSRIVEMSNGFAICTCASPCSTQRDKSVEQGKRPAAIHVGATVRLDPSLIPASGQPAKVNSHAQ